MEVWEEFEEVSVEVMDMVAAEVVAAVDWDPDILEEMVVVQVMVVHLAEFVEEIVAKVMVDLQAD